MDNIISHIEVMKELARRIKTLRLDKKWSRQDLADQAAINVYSLKRFECSGQISLERFLAVCGALGVLDDFKRILKPRARINVDNWEVPTARQRGHKRTKVKVPA